MSGAQNKKIANANKPKKFTLSNLQKQNKEKYDGHIEVTFEGYDEVIKIDKVWKPSKINSLVSEYLLGIRKDLRTADVPTSGGYLYLLMLRHFTSLPIPNEINKQLLWLEALVDSGSFERLVSNLPIDQIDKVNDELQNTIENFEQNDEFSREQHKDVKLKNEEVQQLVDDYISVDSE